MVRQAGVAGKLQLHPAVPFHAVPAAHRLLAPRLEHEHRGYIVFHRGALARALGHGAS